MTNQEKKQYLSQYIRIKEEHSNQLERYRELRSTFENVKAQVLDDMPKGRRETFDKTGELLARLEELESKNEELFDTYIIIERSVMAIQTPVLRELMRLRYLQGNKWDDVATGIRYEWRHTINLHGVALNEIKIKK